MIIPPNMVTIGFDPFPKSSNNMPIHIDHTSIYIYIIYILRILTMVTMMMTMMMMMMVVVVVVAM
jgi:hypothetical protein